MKPPSLAFTQWAPTTRFNLSNGLVELSVFGGIAGIMFVELVSLISNNPNGDYSQSYYAYLRLCGAEGKSSTKSDHIFESRPNRIATAKIASGIWSQDNAPQARARQLESVG
jgi:hypothetical protein